MTRSTKNLHAKHFLSYLSPYLGILRPHIHLIVPVICKLISQLQDIGTQTVSWQARAVATLRRICTSARGAVVEQSLVVVSRTVHCLTRTVTISLNGGWVVDLVIVIVDSVQHTAIPVPSLPLLYSLPPSPFLLNSLLVSTLYFFFSSYRTISPI